MELQSKKTLPTIRCRIRKNQSRFKGLLEIISLMFGMAGNNRIIPTSSVKVHAIFDTNLISATCECTELNYPL